MRFPRSLSRLCFLGLLTAVTVLGGARPGSSAEATVLLSGADPGELWKVGYGGALSISLFNIVGGEIEGIWQGSELPSTSHFSLSAKAYIAPPFGTFVPYGGLGIGLYRESVPGSSDTGSMGLVFVGVKLKFPVGLVVRGEYQWVDMPTPAPVDLDHRYFAGLGLSF